MNKSPAIVCLLLGSFVLAGEAPKHSYKPDAGYVPDAKTAIRIAVAVWEPIYGEKQIAKEKPYQATLTGLESSVRSWLAIHLHWTAPRLGWVWSNQTDAKQVPLPDTHQAHGVNR